MTTRQARRALMLEVLRTPAAALRLSRPEWTELLGSARHSNLLPRIAVLLEDGGVVQQLPARVQEQLRGARPIARHHERTIRWEVQRIADALKDLDTRIVLLKGAAYVMANLPAGQGRLATDVDILVPRDQIRDVERRLLAAGWVAVKLHAYDQRFYREWSHELPPLQHSRRRSVVDVHHNILPPTGRVRPDAQTLLSAAVPLKAANAPEGLWTLGPEDMVLHCAVHLFQDGELSGSVRDLVDADALLSDFGGRLPGFWDGLTSRARMLGLERPLFYLLHFTGRMLGTAVPSAAAAQLARPPAITLELMDRLVSRSLLPVAGQHGTFGEETARTLLYIRSHWLRMPPAQLVAHLTRKALRRWSPDKDG
ncbi:MAG: nucleotidyltransferase family protein [Vicinamibacterales bacterium]